jgi:predicted metal-dependent enzyme (double-stranded beta helix superfamily)
MLSLFIPLFDLLRDASSNAIYGLYINGVDSGVEAQLIVKGKVTLNSNDIGMYSFLFSDSKLDIAVENGSTLESCGNTRRDVYGYVTANATATFSGTGYTCDEAKVVFNGDGTVDEPNCQDCS